MPLESLVQVFGVAVIDSGFRDFVTRVVPSLSEPAKFLCYDSDLNAFEGFVPTLTPMLGSSPVVTPGPTPTPKFAACETGLDGSHGTQVVESLLEIAPDVKLYISDADRSVEYVQTLDWLTAGRSDNTVEGRPVYDATANDSYNVKVINHSGSGVWTGLVTVRRISLVSVNGAC